ncbi:exodeoxyribonuclease VII large subunit, partial [Tritonibacter sp. SIMBA_163]
VLDRGFAVVRDEAGAIVASAEALQTGQAVSLELADGRRGAVIDAAPSAKRPTRKAKAGRSGGQGDLF